MIFFFFQAVTSAYFQKVSTNSCLPDDHPPITADYDFWTIQTPVMRWMENPSTIWKSHQVHTLWPYVSECGGWSMLLIEKASYSSLLPRRVCSCLSLCHRRDPATCHPSLSSWPPSLALCSKAHLLHQEDSSQRREYLACNWNHIIAQEKEK